MADQRTLDCPKCTKKYRSDTGENAWKRHIRTCQRDVMAELDPEHRSYVGRWFSFEIDKPKGLPDSEGWKVNTTVYVKLSSCLTSRLLRPNGTYTYHQIREAVSYGQHSIKTVTKRGSGTWSFTGGIFLKGDVWTKHRCACGGARGDIYQENFVLSLPLDKFSSTFKKRYEKTCFICHETGHYAKVCPQCVCYACNEKGHKAKNCPNKPVTDCGTAWALPFWLSLIVFDICMNRSIIIYVWGGENTFFAACIWHHNADCDVGQACW